LLVVAVEVLWLSKVAGNRYVFNLTGRGGISFTIPGTAEDLE
jgi:hypothetical protein